MKTQNLPALEVANLPPRVCFLLLLLSSVAAPSVFAEEAPVAQIVLVEFPPSISPGAVFAVVVSVEYSGAYSTDIAILDTATGTVLDSKALFTYMPAGTTSYTFLVTGRLTPGPWKLEATIRTWRHNAWYNNPDGGTYPFEIGILDLETAAVVLTSNVSSCSITFDGAQHTIPPSGLEITTNRGLHMIRADPELAIGDGAKAIFDHWSDGVQSPQREIYVAGQLELSAMYRIQYFLSVESAHGETVGSGWYTAGMNASFAAMETSSSETPRTDAGTPLRFSHWSGDSDSSSFSSWIIMDQPKRVIANWVTDTQEMTQNSQLAGMSAVLLLSSLVLAAVGLTFRLAGRRRAHLTISRPNRMARLLLLTLLTSLASASVQSTHALVPTEPRTVTIGDASWYHWSGAGSDTCLIWLGGGTVGESGTMLNPYDFESYNTIHFIQELAGFYDVLVLRAGSATLTNQALNRTIRGESYPGPTHFMQQIRGWINQAGYSYAFMVGYSVGALVGAKETLLVSPSDWASPDGLVLITPQIPQDLSARADTLHASLLVLYGDLMPAEFIASGQRFFENAPVEGWDGISWYHKEYHVISGVQHEVWTDGQTGGYDQRAALLILKFIEKSKSLQLEHDKERIFEITRDSTRGDDPVNPAEIHISSVNSAAKVAPRQGFRISSSVRFDVEPNMTIALVAVNLDTATIESVAMKNITGSGESDFSVTLVSGNDLMTTRLALVLLTWSENGWAFPRNPTRNLSIDVTDLLAITLILGYSGVPIEVDGQTLLTGQDGRLVVNTTAGQHQLSCPSMIEITGTSRAVFRQLNETQSASMEIDLQKDTAIFAFYQRQYYLDVSSAFGHTLGTGWYDENAIATIYVMPTLISDETTRIFEGWSDNSAGVSPVSEILVDGSRDIQAAWRELSPGETGPPAFSYEVLLGIATVLLLVSGVFALASARQFRRSSSGASRTR